MGPCLCYLVMCRIFGLLRYCRRTALDRDIELMVLRHEVRVLKRQLHGRVRYRTTDRAILAALSQLLPRWRCFLITPETLLAGIGSSREASGNVREPSEVLDVPHSAMRSSSSSSASAGRTAAGMCSHPGRASRARDPRLGKLDPPGTSTPRSRTSSSERT